MTTSLYVSEDEDSCMSRKFHWKTTSLYVSEDEDQLHAKEVPLDDY